jgi:urease accessory protein
LSHDLRPKSRQLFGIMLRSMKGKTMTTRPLAALLAASLLALTAGVAQAHTGVGDTSGFAHGFMHPIGGLDHILAMVMVGVFAAQLGGRAVWLVPASFVAVMALGGVFGLTGIPVPFVELGIGLSVVVLGAVVAFKLHAAVPLAMGLVGFFAIFHGYAHGAEMPENAGGLAYGAGFMLATALLHATGVGLALTVSRWGGASVSVLVRSIGALVALAGLGMVSGLM